MATVGAPFSTVRGTSRADRSREINRDSHSRQQREATADLEAAMGIEPMCGALQALCASDVCPGQPV